MRDALLAPAALCLIAAGPAQEEVPRQPAVRQPAVTGVVRLVGPRPVRQRWEVSEEMRPFHDAEWFEDEAWLIGEKGELANCVLTLTPLDGEPPLPPEPVKGAVFAKVGPRFVPRVLVVPRGTEVTLRNVDSPCNGFACREVRDSFNFTMSAGKEKKHRFQSRGPVKIGCDVRESMRGVVYLVTTPYHAKTDAAGRFSIAGVPAGRYRLRVWHEVLGRVDQGVPAELLVPEGDGLELELAVPSPRKEESDGEGEQD